MITRNATIRDVPSIVDLAVESVSRNPLPVRIDRDAMAETAKECLTPQHFVRVAEVDSKVVACVGAQTTEGWWYERSQSNVLLFYTRVPGAGIKLLREYAAWVKARPMIKMAIFSLEPDSDPRLAKLLNRLGFTMSTPQLVYVRGMKDVQGS